MVELVKDTAQPTSSTSNIVETSQNSETRPQTNGISTLNGLSSEENATVNGPTSNEHIDQPGEWESFEVHYVGTGITSTRARSGEESDSSFVSDSDDDQYEGYEPITLQSLQAHDTDTDSAQSDEEILDGLLPDATTPRAEEPLSGIIHEQARAEILPASVENQTATTPSNDIPLDQERVNQITAAMSGFVLPPHPNMPDDTKILEMIKKMTAK